MDQKSEPRIEPLSKASKTEDLLSQPLLSGVVAKELNKAGREVGRTA